MSLMQEWFGTAGTGPSRSAIAITYSAPATNQVINIPTLPGYVAGKTDLTVTINSGVYVYATSIANSGLSLTGGKAAGDTVTVVNNGYIAGQGGNGANVNQPSGNPGGPAFSISSPIILTNNSYIGGGGGGGGGTVPATSATGGGGGAGGGNGAPAGYPSHPASIYVGSGGAGGYAGSAGTPGAPIPTPSGTFTNPAGQGGGAGGGSGALQPIGRGSTALAGGGGGGSIFPGTGGSGGTPQPGFPTSSYPASAGGAGNSVGSGGATYASGGGGGWGAAGGVGYASPCLSMPGGTGGKAINLNGNTITYPALGTIWGAVS